MKYIMRLASAIILGIFVAAAAAQVLHLLT